MAKNNTNAGSKGTASVSKPPKSTKKGADKGKKTVSPKKTKAAPKKTAKTKVAKGAGTATGATKAAPADANIADLGIVIVDDTLEVDQEKINEERKAYLEEARSQEAFD